MVKQYANRNSKAIRNFKSATNNTLRTTGLIATKGIEKTARWLVSGDTRATQRNNLIELERSANDHLASMSLSNRRLERLSNSVRRLINTGKGHSTFDVAVGWLVDHALHLWCLLWGLIWSIVSSLLMTIFSVLLIILFNVIFFTQYFGFCFCKLPPILTSKTHPLPSSILKPPKVISSAVNIRR